MARGAAAYMNGPSRGRIQREFGRWCRESDYVINVWLCCLNWPLRLGQRFADAVHSASHGGHQRAVVEFLQGHNILNQAFYTLHIKCATKCAKADPGSVEERTQLVWFFKEGERGRVDSILQRRR